MPILIICIKTRLLNCKDSYSI